MGKRDPYDFFAALEQEQIVPHFQPIAELRTGTLTGFELLARWTHPTEGIIYPDEFIPVAEANGCVGRVMEAVLRQAFAAAAVLPTGLTLAVNVSSLQFHEATLPQQIQRLATAGGFALDRLVLEVTESALVGNLDQARAITLELKAMGVRLALDDFGTGYSSLRHLQSLPFDELKVDASFVRSMGLSRESRKIAAAVVGLGHSLGLTTVAEGVETKNQADMLLWLGCDQGQGWLYGRPVPADGLQEILNLETLLSDAEAEDDMVCGPIVPILEVVPAQRMAQLKATYDGAPIGLCFLDRNMRYLSANKRMAELNGVSIGEHLGRRVSDVHPVLFVQFEPYIKRALAGESLSGVEIQAVGPDGSGRTLSLSYEPARDEAQEVVGVSVAMMEIPERRRSEQALSARIAELELEVASLKMTMLPVEFEVKAGVNEWDS